jgi:L-ascorbate metabolism protein UlaG (beta-lactamase superfamily)
VVDKQPRDWVSFVCLNMEIAWSGHSCFTLKGKTITLVIDPCPPEYGCVSRWGAPQAVLVSHAHKGHSFTAEIPGEPRVFRGPGEYEIGGAFITGIGTFHDGEGGTERGKNTVYVIETEGLVLCHLGDLGHPLSGHALREVGKVDVLFVPVGDVTTLSVPEARSLARSVQARYILPMHYRRNGVRSELEPVETFLTAMGVSQAESRAKLSVSSTNLPLDPQVLVLSCETRAG